MVVWSLESRVVIHHPEGKFTRVPPPIPASEALGKLRSSRHPRLGKGPTVPTVTSLRTLCPWASPSLGTLRRGEMVEPASFGECSPNACCGPVRGGGADLG